MKLIELIAVENLLSYLIYCGGLGMLVFLFQQRMRDAINESRNYTERLGEHLNRSIEHNRLYLKQLQEECEFLELMKEKNNLIKLKKNLRITNSKRKYSRAKGSGR